MAKTEKGHGNGVSESKIAQLKVQMVYH